ncbi:MAG TPA: STT3 domain-containing protein [Thermoanaerobaculia bacterium]|nr:STT3 domain-containing protein [Thermoanaerobaculia bacterium]
MSPGRRRALLIAVAAFVLAFGIRIGNAPRAFAGGVPVISPLDELYHWKRIAFSAAHFPAVLDFDPDRGLAGAFCPWPPLYDLACAAAARLAGATGAYDVLSVIVWIPPLVASLLVAAVVGLLARARGNAAALLIAPLATAPMLVFPSLIGEIDHHWIEPFFALAILGATTLVLRARTNRDTAVAAIALSSAICVALFVQTALIVAAALALLSVLISGTRREPFIAAASAFVASASVIAAYRLTRLPAYPDSAWFLGRVHVAALLGATVAALAMSFLLRERRIVAIAIALIAGALTIAAIPGAAEALGRGATFFHGDPWLDAILEFRPVWRPLHDILPYALALGLGAISSVALLVARRHVPAAIFAVAYIALTISSRRFAGVAVAVAAVTSWLLIVELDRKALRLTAIIVLVAIPPLQLVAEWRSGTGADLTDGELRFLRAANWLRDRGRPGRVIAPWSYGHMLDVIGKRPVVVDNFGTMPDEATFRMAYATLVAHDDRRVAAFADRWNVAYVIIESPAVTLGSYVHFLSLPIESFVRADTATTWTLRAWCWRAFFPAVRPPDGFHRVYGDGTLMILERDATPARAPSPTTSRRGLLR